MRWTYLLLILSAFMLMGADECQYDGPPPHRAYCSINADGSGFKEDYRLMSSTFGKAFYLSDSMIFHLGSRLAKRVIGTAPVYLSPSGMTITDTKYLAIDEAGQMLYFAADNAICRIGFDGQNFSRLSPTDRAVYSAPALSSCGDYLTAIRDKRITRLNLQTGEWLILEEPVTAYYAVYIGEADEYYYYSRYRDDVNETRVALCKLDAQRDSTLIYSDYDPYSWDPSSAPDGLNAQASDDCRYFAMHFAVEPYQVVDWMGFYYYVRNPYHLNVYDRKTGQTFQVLTCFSYAFVPDSEDILYSHLKFGMADLIRRDLSTGQESMLWDGYYDSDNFIYSVSEIYPRYDGQVIFLNAWSRAQGRYTSKSLTAPGLNELEINREISLER